MEIIDKAVNVHTHTEYSLMDSTNKPKELVAKVKAMGQTSICITDHGETSGLIEVYNECKKQGIHMVFGCEHYLVPDVLIKEVGYKHIIFWAKNNIGYNNLLKLTTEAHQNFYRKPRVDIDMIRKYSEGLAMSTACIGGWLRIKDEYGNNIVDTDLLEQFIEIFPNDLWVELHTYSIDEQKEWNRILIDVAKKYNLPLIAACDAHYTNKEDAYVHKMWITQGKEREDGYYQHPEFFLHSGQEMREALSYLPSDIVEEAIANTKVLADSCQVEIKFGEQHYPKVESENPKESVRQIMLKNWRSKVPRSEWKAHEARVNHEMPILEKADYFPYFLIMHDIVKYAESVGIPLGFSRGSAAGCDVAYIMGIHRTNPIKFDLMFERFLHEERVTPCDIDVDVSQKRRGELIEYIKNKYGHDRVFQARTYGYMGAKGALKRAGKSLGFDSQYINSLSKSILDVGDDEFNGEEKERHLLDSIVQPDGGYTIFGVYVEQPDIKPLISLAKAFVGVLQSYSVHPSGVIVFPDDPTNYCAIEKSKENYVTSYEFHTLEAIGCLKLDILGVKMTDVIADTVNLVGNTIDVNDLPMDDKKTFDMLCQGKTSGVFQIESMGFTRLVKAIQPKHFEDLAPLMATFRPAIIAAGLLDTYIDRKTGKEIPEYPVPELEPLLKSTGGLMLYQEEMLAVVRLICAYSLGQADLIRRACGRKLPEEMARIKPDFISRAIANGYSDKVANKIFELVEYFAGYGFSKCLSGQEYIYRAQNGKWQPSIEQMYKIMHDKEYAKETGHCHLHKKYNSNGYGKALSMDDKGILKENNIIDITPSGTRDTYLVTTESGCKVRCTMNHGFPTPNGKKMLSELMVGSELYVVGDYQTSVSCANFYTIKPDKTNVPQREFYCNMNTPWLCNSCHKKEQYKLGRVKKFGKGLLSNIDKIKSIGFFATENTYDIEMEAPNHNLLMSGGIIVSNSHSYGYGWMAYVTAYLKANYTKEFMVSLINSEDNQEDTIPYIDECKSLGIPIIPPDLSVGNTQWIIEGNSIRIGLHYLKGVGKNLCADYTETLNDIIAHNHKNTIESLIKSGALDYLGHTRAYMLTNLSSLQDTLKRVKQCQQKIRENKELLRTSTLDKDKRKYQRQIDSWAQKLNEAQAHTELTEESYDEVKGEVEVLGFSFKEIPKVKLGKLTNIFKKNDKNGREMSWLNLDSDYGNYRCTVFANGWKLIADKVIVGESYKFVVGDTGILEEIKVDGEVIKLNERKWGKKR